MYELRAYFFMNMYLSSIQQGIQAGHIIGDMAARYLKPGVEGTNDIQMMFYEWANAHKTMVVLNAGYGEEIHDLITFFRDPTNPYPWEDFRESEPALDGATTGVGIVLPSKIFTASKMIRDRELEPEEISNTGTVSVWTDGSKTDMHYNVAVSKWEFDLILRLNNYGLAR